ncbi:MAG: uracil-DNA glycosylase [Acidaminococcaceae bacterium]|nr:uracil-DNA glycosylase [Acidaminococcaceae bacterium]
MDIAGFIDTLRDYQREKVFNPWRDFDPVCDIGADAPLIRRENLQRYLELRSRAKYIFVAEGLGYQGGHFTGIAITSERILLGHHPDIERQSVLGEWEYCRTSNPLSVKLNTTQKTKGFNEPTDTVVWNALARHGLASFDVILWNIFPFHPHREGELLSNRTPTSAELDEGIKYTKMLLEMFPCLQIVAIGQKAAATLARYGVQAIAVPHPSMGGANKFKAAVAQIFAGDEHG